MDLSFTATGFHVSYHLGDSSIDNFIETIMK